MLNFQLYTTILYFPNDTFSEKPEFIKYNKKNVNVK